MMKNNKTESEIFEQIRESLEHYEEAYVPGSWENFLQKRKNSNRKIFLRIASGIAACLLVGFLGLNYFQSDFQSEKRDRSVLTAKQSSDRDLSVEAAGKSADGDLSVETAGKSADRDLSVETAGQSSNRDLSVETAGQSADLISAKADIEKGITGEAPAAAMVAGSDVKPGTDVKPGIDVKQSGYSGIKTASIAEGNNNLSAEGEKKIPAQPMASGVTAESREQVATLQPDAKPQSTINNTDATKSSQDTIKSKTQNIFLTAPQTGDNQHLAAAENRKVRFGLNFSPGVSTTESSNSLNYMGGISADISLSSKVALSTGLQFENQSFVKKMPGIVSSANAPVNQTKTTVTNLDFPVNITWKFAAEKSHAYYVSAGLSSLVYLSQENKNTTYSQDLIPVSSLVNGEEIKSYSVVSQMSVTQDAVSPYQTFDLAGRVNLMVGYEIKMSDRIYIHFEPYAKFPTSSQEAGSLNHTTTGINFKISF